MGKKPRAILKTDNWSVYPIILKSKPDKEGYCGILIRATNRQKSIDVEVYDHKGIRLKVKPDHFANGKVTSGGQTANHTNRIIDEVKLKVVNFISSANVFNKQLLLSHLYDHSFLNAHKRKRTKYITIPIHDSHTGKIVETVEIDSKEANKLLANIDSTDEIEDEDDLHAILITEKLSKEERERLAQKQEELKKLTAHERYIKGEYDKRNIVEVAGQILYLNKNDKTKKPFSKNWKMAIMKLFDYRSRFNPSESIKDFSVEWISDVITTIKEKGYSTAHPKNFDVFKYNPEIFKKARVEFYTDLSLEKFIKNMKEVFRWLIDNEKLPFISIDKIKYEDFNLSKVTQETKKEYYLTKQEFDKLFSFKFKKDDKYSVDQLSKARDLFVLQTWLGGLRPNELYNDNVTILDDGKGKRKVHYYISKDGKVDNENPICTYSEQILARYKNDFGKILIEYNEYCKLLKVIAKQVFDRVIIKTEERDGIKKKLKLNINTEFESYFARKTFQMLLKEEAGISDYDIKAFTGHKTKDIQSRYTTFTLKRKREVMDKIKPETNH